VNHPKARTAGYARQFDDLVKSMKKKAESNGVQVVPLRKYLDMIGYRPQVSSKVR